MAVVETVLTLVVRDKLDFESSKSKRYFNKQKLIFCEMSDMNFN